MRAKLRKKLMLIILDGLGVAPHNKGNAVTIAKPKNLISLWDSYPHTYLKASEEAVGLPKGVYGNSEVGHINIGAGKTILQNLPKINKAIRKGAYYSNQTLLNILEHVKNHNSAVHIMGCASDGAVHAHINHFMATHKFFYQKGFKGKLFFHAFTDGRDTPPKSAEKYLNQLQYVIDGTGLGHIATLCGRAFAMDRNLKWERTEKAYRMLTEGKGNNASSWEKGLQQAYDSDQTDEYIEPTVIPYENEQPVIQSNDAVVFVNFRADRAQQISDAFITPDFSEFDTKNLQNLFYAGMVPYRKDFPNHVLMPKEYIRLSLGRLLSEYDLRQLRIAESEKFPHVTYFFNGGIAIKYPGEDRIEIPSPNVPTYDEKPEMSSQEVGETLEEKIKTGIYDFILLNLANPDMVGHTGNIEACIKSIKATDHIVGRLVKVFTSLGGTVIITADHGNVEEVIKFGTEDVVDTEHSLNPVPFIVVDKDLPKTSMRYGELADIAPTVLKLMGLNEPEEMHGDTLLKL
jgi:2,3-bisphosphoglycerate-independent phosphoglycerate mutase